MAIRNHTTSLWALLALALLAGLLVSPIKARAAIATPWNATSTDAGYISPNLINGNQPEVWGRLFKATSTTASSTLPLLTSTSLAITGQATGCAQFSSGGQILSTGTACGSGGGTPGGLNLQVQYNNAGAFGGISGAVTDGTILNLTNPLLGGATLTTSTVNGVTLTTGGSAAAYLNGTGAYSVPIGTTYTATYPITLTGTAFGLAFGTTTSNTWAGTQTFTNAPILSSLATPAGTFLAADATGNIIATTSAGGTNYWTSSGQKLYNNTGTTVGVNTTNPGLAAFEVQGTTTDATANVLTLWNSTPATILSVGNDGATAIKSSAAGAFSVGSLATSTNAFQVNNAAPGTGLILTSAAPGSGTTLTGVSAAPNELLTISAKGTGGLNLGSSTNNPTQLMSGNSINIMVNGTTRFNITQTNVGASNIQVFTINSQTALNTATTQRFLFRLTAANSALTASTEFVAAQFNLAEGTQTHATGDIALQRDMRIVGGLHAFAASSTIANRAAFSVDQGSSGVFATTTNNYAILLPGVALTGVNVNSYGFGAVASTGATNNYAASTTGRWVMNALTSSASLQTGILCLSSANEVINESVACVASAARYKENIKDSTTGLATLMKLRPVSFTWKKDYLGARADDPNQNGMQYSLIADEVQKVDPHLVSVTTSTTTFEGITYAPGTVNGLADLNHWVSLFTASIQEQQAEIESFKKNITRSAEENWQWGAIGLLFAWNLVLTFRRKKTV